MKTFSSLFLAALLVLSFASCKHEIKDDGTTDNTPTDTTDISKNLLAKTTLTTTAGVTTQTFRYDAQNRLVWYGNTSTVPGYFEDTSKIVWDANGHISKIIYSSDTSRKFPDPKLDSVVYNVFYDAAASKYTYKLVKYKAFTTSFKDSIVYGYDGTRISKEEMYYFDYGKTNTYIKYGLSTYAYNADGDLNDQKTTYYNVDNSNTDYSYELAFTYNDKGVNLLNLGNEAILIGLPDYYSGHILRTAGGSYPQSPQFNSNYSFTYKFNTKYRPLTADVSDAVSNTKGTMAYSYQ